MRLNRYLAACGLGSRRGVESLVTEGRVKVNGQTCSSLGTRIGEEDAVVVDGRRVSPKAPATILYHKPRALVCSRRDELGRPTIYNDLPTRFSELAHVGRLDRDSEGLLVLTNDGELAHRLTRASSGIEKEYIATLDRAFDPEDRQKLLDGIDLPDGRAKVVLADVFSPRRLRIILHQGMKRQIRLMLETLGYQVNRLLRTRIGSLDLAELDLGKWRAIGVEEIKLLEVNPKQQYRPAKKRFRKKPSSKSARRDSRENYDRGDRKKRRGNKDRSERRPSRKRPSGKGRHSSGPRQQRRRRR